MEMKREIKTLQKWYNEQYDEYIEYLNEKISFNPLNLLKNIKDYLLCITQFINI